MMIRHSWHFHGILQARILEWVAVPIFSSGDLPNPGIEPRSPALQVDSLPAEPQGKPSGKESTCQCRRWKRFHPWVRRRAWQPTPVFLPGESHGQRSLVGYSPQGHKRSDMTEAKQASKQYFCTYRRKKELNALKFYITSRLGHNQRD